MFIRPKGALVYHYPHYLLSACVVAFLLVSLASCKSAPQASQTAAVPEDTRSNPDEPTKSIPPDLFKELPIYPGATVEHVHKPKGAMREIAFSTPAQLNEVVEFFKTHKVREAGKTIDQHLERLKVNCAFKARHGDLGALLKS